VIGVFTAAVLGTAIPLGCAPPRAIETSQLLASTSSASELPERLRSSGNVARKPCRVPDLRTAAADLSQILKAPRSLRDAPTKAPWRSSILSRFETS